MISLKDIDNCRSGTTIQNKIWSWEAQKGIKTGKTFRWYIAPESLICEHSRHFANNVFKQSLIFQEGLK